MGTRKLTFLPDLSRIYNLVISMTNASVHLINHFLCLSGSREQAFVYALSSAALTRAISKACSIGATTKCSCGRLPNEPAPGEFKWGGCGDDIYFGLAFSKLFADAQFVGKKRKLSKRSRVNLHNTGVGRRVSIRHLLLFAEASLFLKSINYFLKPQFQKTNF